MSEGNDKPTDWIWSTHDSPHELDWRLENTSLMRIAMDLVKVDKLISDSDQIDDLREASSLLCMCIYDLNYIIQNSAKQGKQDE